MWDLIVSVPDHCLSFYFISLLSINTSSYSSIALGTYNRWKVEFVLKTK